MSALVTFHKIDQVLQFHASKLNYHQLESIKTDNQAHFNGPLVLLIATSGNHITYKTVVIVSKNKKNEMNSSKIVERNIKTEDLVVENKSLRSLIQTQKAILQQLQIQKEHLIHELKDTKIDGLEALDEIDEEKDDDQFKVLIKTLPVFSQSEARMESFNKRRKVGEVDPDIETSKIHLQCTEHCVSSKNNCQGWKPFYEVQKGAYFGTRLITSLGGKSDTPRKQKKAVPKKCGKPSQKLRRSKRLSDEGRNFRGVPNEKSETTVQNFKVEASDDQTTLKVEKTEVNQPKQEFPKPTTGLSKRQETYFSNLIRSGVDRYYVEMEYLRLIGQPMSATVYANLFESEIKPSFAMDEVNRANEFYNFKFQLKAKLLKEVKTKNIKITDFVTIAHDLKAKTPFCKNPMISKLKFSTGWIHNLLRGMPVKRSNNSFCFSKK